MTRTTVHLLRHGEVYNPEGVLYGRLPGFRLSDDGQQMAHDAARALEGRDVIAVVASPLQRAQETARPTAELFALDIVTDDRLIESDNVFEGKRWASATACSSGRSTGTTCATRFVPSWGEPYVVIARRMLAAAVSARDLARGHEAVCVSHQLPIWTVRRSVEGRPLWHRPDRRQCGLASLTSITWDDDRHRDGDVQRAGGCGGSSSRSWRVGDSPGAGRSRRGGPVAQPMVFWPSSDSRRMSA